MGLIKATIIVILVDEEAEPTIVGIMETITNTTDVGSPLLAIFFFPRLDAKPPAGFEWGWDLGQE